ncbi:MAG: hypothetical protein AAGL34_09020 [Bacteroidota bacterium]
MKTKGTKQTLSLNKLTIAKLSNPYQILGGNQTSSNNGGDGTEDRQSSTSMSG